MDENNPHSPYILKLEGKINNDCEIIHSKSINDKRNVNFLEKQTHYEIIDTKIKNSIDDTTSSFNLELAAKIRYKDEFQESNFLRVPMRKAREESGKGLGFATLTPTTLITKLNEVINSSITIPNAFGVESIFKIQNKEIEINLLPYMGIFINDSYIFSEVFKINNANVEGYVTSKSPAHFDKLPTDADKIETTLV